jgi:KDO2-lipid IV(A) lauroyltransferase
MARQIGNVQARIEYTGIAAVVGALRAMPLERAVRAGARLGGWAMNFDRPNRKIALTNLEIAFPDYTTQARLGILRAMYERKSKGRGLLVLTGHFGNFELLQLAHSIYGYHIAIVHRALRNPLIDAAVCGARVRYGNRIIERKAGGAEMLRMLRKNWMIAIALDLDVRKGVFVDFFGKSASTSDGMARLAMATGTPVIPAFMVREGDSIHHKIKILPQIEIVKTRDREECVLENTRRFSDALEQMVREHPDHWNWIHRRWKTRPPGEHRFY